MEVLVPAFRSSRAEPGEALKSGSRGVTGARNHQGKDNRILFPSRPEAKGTMGAVRCRERLGGLLKDYEREAA
jgi:hypothetical protein